MQNGKRSGVFAPPLLSNYMIINDLQTIQHNSTY